MRSIKARALLKNKKVRFNELLNEHVINKCGMTRHNSFQQSIDLNKSRDGTLKLYYCSRSNGHIHLNFRMGIVALNGEIAGDEVFDVGYLSLDLQSWERARSSFQLLLQRRYVIVVYVGVSQRVDEISGLN